MMTRSVAVAVALALGAAACGGKGIDRTGDDPIVLVHHGYDGEPRIMYVGRLVYDSPSRCLHFAFESGSRRAPVWPKGTEPVRRGGKRGVNVPGFGDLLEGERFSTGGGGDVGRAPKGLPASCVPKGGIIVFNEEIERQK
ncbi:hypothetical protein [Actinomadura kijaniata]|uniref:hypothetical protein n=1 Tax=Actinomadura kijaniata TaxID=46161 RepID=UPI00082A25FB|nr:hypothetical protein [Actinomadura kijaniata]